MSSDEDVMEELVNQSLKKISKGAGIIFIGTMFGMLFGFLSRVLIARHVTQAEYGLYSLALMVSSVAVAVSLLGLQEGMPRYIGLYRGKKDTESIRGTVYTSVPLVAIGSTFIAALLFFKAETVSLVVFDDPGLTFPLKIFAVSVPFLALVQILTGVYRGFDKTKPKVYFQNIAKSGLFLLFLVPVIVMNMGFEAVIYAYLMSILFTLAILTIYLLKNPPIKINPIENKTNNVAKELLVFSAPLLIVFILNMVMNWTDTLMLGYYTSSENVGLYNGARPLAQLLPVFLTSAAFIYTPVASQLYSRRDMKELRRVYSIITRWVCFLTLPVFLTLIVFPEPIISTLFGSEYVSAAPALQILSMGFAFHAFLGVNGLTLMTLGESRTLMLITGIGAGGNILLNVLMIPVLGITGAAIATSAAYITSNFIVSLRLYKKYGIHPLTKNYLQPLIATLIPAILIYTLYFKRVSIKFYLVPIMAIAFSALLLAALTLTSSIEKEDRMIIKAIVNKVLKPAFFAKGS